MFTILNKKNVKMEVIMYNRISIVGGSGSGKSTLCNILAK